MVTRSTRIIFFLQRSFWGNQMCENPREFPWFECERTEPKVRGTCPHCSWQNIPVPLLPCTFDVWYLCVDFFFFHFQTSCLRGKFNWSRSEIVLETLHRGGNFAWMEVLHLYNFFLADNFHVWLSFNWLTEWSIYICLFYRWWTHSTCFRLPALFSGSVTSIIIMLPVFSSYLSCPLESHCMKPKEWVYKRLLEAYAITML